MSSLPSGLSVMFAWPGRKAMLCLHAISLPANSAPGALLTQVSVEKARKERAEPSGQCDGQINSTESLTGSQMESDSPLTLMESHFRRSYSMMDHRI